MLSSSGCCYYAKGAGLPDKSDPFSKQPHHLKFDYFEDARRDFLVPLAMRTILHMYFVLFYKLSKFSEKGLSWRDVRPTSR